MKKTFFKRVTSLVAATALMASTMVSAFAAGTTITIKPGTYSKTGESESERYVAYQIFKGTIGNGVEGGFTGSHEHEAGDNVYDSAVDLANYSDDAEDFADKVIEKVDAGTAVDADLEDLKLANELMNLFADYENATGGKGYDAWKTDYENGDEDAIDYLYEIYWENRHTMQDIQWGADVTDVEELLEELAGFAFDNGSVIDKAFDAIYAAYESEKDTDEDRAKTTAAQRVAKVLAGTFKSSELSADLNITPNFEVGQDKINTAFLQKFAKVVYSVIKNDSNTKKSTWDEENGCWKISDVEEGYYLIADSKDDLDEVDIRAPYFVDVFTGETVEIDLKSDAPTIDKTIEKVDGTDETVADDDRTATAEIGDTVSYKLVGTLPENFGDYFNAFYYRFTDTLDKGLTLDEDSIKITIVGLNDGTETDKTAVYDKDGVDNDFDGILTSENFSVSTATDNSTGKTTLKITFTDLLNALKEYVDNDDDFADIDWTKVTVVIEYDAVLNSDAKTGVDGNKNAANLTYTNDPNSDYDPDEDIDDPDDDIPEDTTTTTDRETFVFTYGISLDKEDINAVKLAGAGFTVTDKVTKDTAVFVKGDKDGEYIFVGWADDSFFDDDEFDADAFKDDEEIQKRLEAVLGAEYGDADLYTEITTAPGNPDDDGNASDTTLAAGALSIKGLNTDVTYVFSETTAPENYKAVEDFEVTLVAEVSWTENTREEATADWGADTAKEGSISMYEDAVTEADESEDLIKVSDYKYTGKLYGDKEAEDIGTQVSSPDGKTEIASNDSYNAPSAGWVTLRVEDPHQTNNLPGTGGAGVYFYYIVGGALVLLAGAALFFTRKKTDK